jgi:hypothetical protein
MHQSHLDVSVTNLERTIVDITVRPAYSGGVHNVLKAYRLAQPKLSIPQVTKTLRALNYVYPYYQSIGFYLDLAETYHEIDIQLLLDFGPFQHDFYLDYGMVAPAYFDNVTLTKCSMAK